MGSRREFRFPLLRFAGRRSARRVNRLQAFALFIVLYALWLALSGQYSPFYLAAGAVCSALVVGVAARMGIVNHEKHPLQLLHRLPLYWGWLALQMLVAALDVSRRVLSPRLDIDPVLETVPSSQESELARAIYANSITLTPGTLSTAVDTDRIEVHALSRRGLQELAAGPMDERVRRLEGGR